MSNEWEDLGFSQSEVAQLFADIREEAAKRGPEEVARLKQVAWDARHHSDDAIVGGIIADVEPQDMIMGNLFRALDEYDRAQGIGAWIDNDETGDE